MRFFYVYFTQFRYFSDDTLFFFEEGKPFLGAPVPKDGNCKTECLVEGGSVAAARDLNFFRSVVVKIDNFCSFVPFEFEVSKSLPSWLNIGNTIGKKYGSVQFHPEDQLMSFEVWKIMVTKSRLRDAVSSHIFFFWYFFLDQLSLDHLNQV